jgi:histidinol-phosphate aminotransferase
MGLLDYYRQFDDMSESEVNEGLRARRAEEKALALEQVPLLDLSETAWPEMPDPEVVSASVYQARGRLNGYPDLHATAVRRALAEHHYVSADRIVIGNGAMELIQTAVYLLISEGDELVIPWPSYGPYRPLATRAGARTIKVDLRDGSVDPKAVLGAVGPRTRALLIANPNNPTGTYLKSEQLGELLAALPDHVHLLLDEALVHFQDAEEEDACMKLVDAFPRLVVFRSFSKIYGLSGVRAGYAVGSGQDGSLLAAIAPVLGVNALTQAAVVQALKMTPEVARRRQDVIAERARLTEALGRIGVDAPPSQANFVWMHAPELTGEQLAERLEESRVRVMDGTSLGDVQRVRAAILSQPATDRLIWSLEQAIGPSVS